MQERTSPSGTFSAHAAGPPDPGRGSAAPDGPRSGANGGHGKHHRGATYATTSPTPRQSGPLSFADLAEHVQHRRGRTTTTCPLCSPHRRKRTERCATVWLEPGFATLCCHHCDANEWASDGEAYRPASVPRATTDYYDRRQRARAATHLWGLSVPIAGTVAERYLRNVRGIRSPLPPTLRFLAPHGKHGPRMVAAFGLTGEPEPGVVGALDKPTAAIHLTPLAPDGSGKAGNKRMLGAPSGNPIVLAGWTDANVLFVTGGIEDGLIAADAGAGAVWAAGSGPHMRALADTVPSWCEGVTILADDNDTDRRGAFDLAAGLHQRGIDASVRLTATRRAAA